MAKRKKLAEGKMARAYVFALDPTPAQEVALRSHCGGARFAYNHMLATLKAAWDQRDAEKTYGVPDDLLTPYIGWSHYTLRKLWNSRKDAAAPWWSENSKEAYSNALAGLSSALKNWDDSRKGKRAGPKVEFPVFHGKRHRKSFTITTGVMRCEPSRHHVTLPVIGAIHTLESTRKLSRLIERGDARILRATVSYRRGRWQVSLLAELPRPASRPLNGRIVGIDVGVKDWIVAAEADGTEVMRVPVPKRIIELEAKQRKLQRRNRNRQEPRKGVAPSKRWQRGQDRTNRVGHHIAAIREDTLHKATTELAGRYDTIVTETLNVKGMSRKGKGKRGLNRAIARAGMATTIAMVSYKATEHLKVDRWFPSSKTCSSCRAVKAKLRLDERTFVCEHTACGHTADRDTNAATNLALYGERNTAGSPLVAARGAVRKTSTPLRAGLEAAGGEARSPKSGQSTSGNGGIHYVVI